MNDLQVLTPAGFTYVTPDGAGLRVDRRGDASVTLVLIPGALCDSRAWAPQFEALSGRFRCFSLGRRPGPGGAPRFDIWQQAWDLSSFIRTSVEEPCFLVGHSFGGLVALLVNELLPGRVAGVILLDTPLGEEQLETASVVEELRSGRRTTLEMAVEQMTAGIPAEVRQGIRNMMLSVGSDVAAGMLEHAERFVPQMKRLVALAEKVGLMAVWRQETPALEWMRLASPRVRHEILGGGHFIQLEQPEATNSLIEDFVRERLRLLRLAEAV